MARYEDYAKAHLERQEREQAELGKEIAEAKEQQTQRQETPAPSGFEMPERFKGKSPEEVAQSYVELEKAYSRQGNDLGEMRKLVDTLAQTNTTTVTPTEPEPKVEPISTDDLWNDPNEAIHSAVDASPAMKRVAELEAKLAETQRDNAIRAFKEQHPNYNTVVASPEFQNWVNERPERLEALHRADSQWDLSTADVLLTAFEQEQKVKELESRGTFAAATTESPGGNEPPVEATFSRSEWVRKMIRAKQGDLEAEDYIKRNSAAYTKALSTNNVRD